jgi:hypothetical protein
LTHPNQEEDVMTREEQLARDMLDLVERFHGRRSHENKHRRARHMMRSAVPAAVNAIVLLSALRSRRSRRRALLPLAAAYVTRRRRKRR